MSATVSESKKKGSSKKKPKVVKPEVVVDGTALKKAIEVREEKKVYTYGEIWATRLEINEDTNDVRRAFMAFPVQTEEDLANDPEQQKELVCRMKHTIVKNGWFLSDDKPSRSSLKNLEKSMDLLTHEARYVKEIDRNGLVKAHDALVHSLRAINELIELRHKIAGLVNNKTLLAMPKVVPPSDEYYISENKKFVKRKPAPTPDEIGEALGFKNVSVESEEVPEEVRELVKKLGNYGTVSIAKMPVKKPESK